MEVKTKSISTLFMGRVLLILFRFLQYTHVMAEDLQNCTEGVDFRGSKLDRGSDCGYRTLRYGSPYIMNGEDADLGEFPWIARLLYSGKFPNVNDIHPECGGTLIHESYVLTAAHCCNDRLLYVRLGEYDVSRDPDCLNDRCAPPYVDVGVLQHIRHIEYNEEEVTKDICLIKLQHPINFNEYVYPVCLPLMCDKLIQGFSRSTLTVAGWGYTDEESRTLPHVLQRLDIPNVPLSLCQYVWDVTMDQVCAGTTTGKDACMGDSGGPLMVRAFPDDGLSRYFLVGIVSFGSDCNLKHNTSLPGVYTRVSYYIPWILQNMR